MCIIKNKDKKEKSSRPSYTEIRKAAASTIDSNMEIEDDVLYMNRIRGLTKIDSKDESEYTVTKEVWDKMTTEERLDFAKKNGNYDTKKISEKVGSFVEDYNNLLTTSAKSTSSRIENSVDSLKLLTTGKSKDLEEIGISVDSKTGILSFDSGKFSSADMDKVKKLFNGTGSYAYGVATRSSLIDSYAQSEAEKANTYGKNGKYSYNYNSGNIFYDSF